MLGGGAFGAVLAFGANLVLMRELGPIVFGRFALAGATIALLAGGLSLRPAVLAIRARDGAERGPQLWRWTLFECAWMGLVAAAFAFRLPGWVMVLIATELGLHALSTAKALYERDQPYRDLALAESTAATVSHGLAVALALSGFGIGALVARQIGLLAVQALWLARRRRLPAFSGLLPRRGEARLLLRESRGIWLDGWVESLFSRCLVLASGVLGGSVGAGLFAQSWRLAQIPHQFLSPLAGRLALNWAARTEQAADRSRDRRRVLAFLVPTCALMAVLAVFLAEPVVPWLFGEPWREAAPLLAGFAGAIVGTSPFAVLKMHLIVERRDLGLLRARLVQLAGLGLGFLAASWWSEHALFLLALGAGLGVLAACPVAARSLKDPAPAAPAPAELPHAA